MTGNHSPRLRSVARRLAGCIVPRRPRLSIIVPVYDVEEYLPACLDRILAQPVRDYEVVLVDDGSPDGSAAVAQRYVDRHRSFRMVRQANAGLGAARNAGVAASRGELITFLDSDDELPDDAYSHMLATLHRSGSDFAVGRLERDDGVRRFATPRMRENHAEERIGVDIHEMPRMLADVFAVNKIYRREFWDRSGLAFPVGVRYEDQPTLTRAFLMARAFDVVTETVYLWRIREDGTSITQRRGDVADLRDRVVTKRDSHALVMEHAPDAADVWLRDVLPVDMAEYFRSVPGCSEEYWQMLRDCVREFWNDETVPFERTLLPVQQRVMGWFVAQDRRADTERVATWLDVHGPDRLPLRVEGKRVRCLLPGHDDPTVPEDLYVVGGHEQRWEARAVSSRWDAGRLVIEGFALVRGVPTAGVETSLTAWLEPVDGPAPGRGTANSPGPPTEEVRRAVSLRARAEPRATRFVGRDDGAFDDCGFTLTVDVPALARLGAASWRIVLERAVAGIVRRGPVSSWNPPVVAAAAQPVSDGWEGRLRPDAGALVLETTLECERTP